LTFSATVPLFTKHVIDYLTLILMVDKVSDIFLKKLF